MILMVINALTMLWRVILALASLYGLVSEGISSMEQKKAKLTVKVIPKDSIQTRAAMKPVAKDKLPVYPQPLPQGRVYQKPFDPYADGKHTVEQDLEALKKIADTGES